MDVSWATVVNNALNIAQLIVVAWLARKTRKVSADVELTRDRVVNGASTDGPPQDLRGGSEH